MIALLADLGQMLVMFFGSNLKRFAKVFDFLKKIRRTITARCKSFESFEGQASDYVFHHGYKFVFSCVANLGRTP